MKLKLLLALIVVSGLAGCFLEPSGSPQVVFVGETGVSDGRFVMEGELDLGWGQERVEYQDVAVCLYGADGAMFRSVSMGSVPPERRVSIRSDRIPEYVVVHSPDFYDESVSYFYYEREVSGSTVGFVERSIGHPSELPVDPRATGCGPS